MIIDIVKFLKIIEKKQQQQQQLTTQLPELLHCVQSGQFCLQQRPLVQIFDALIKQKVEKI